MAERQYSAGGVVIKGSGDGLRVLLIKDSYGHWTWPKGHIEKGEKAPEAALRETTEETGLVKLEIIQKIGEQKYFFKLHGKLIFKTVQIFLIKCGKGDKLTIQKDEINDARWYPPEKAIETIEYKGSPELVKKAIRIYRQQ